MKTYTQRTVKAAAAHIALCNTNEDSPEYKQALRDRKAAIRAMGARELELFMVTAATLRRMAEQEQRRRG